MILSITFKLFKWLLNFIAIVLLLGLLLLLISAWQVYYAANNPSQPDNADAAVILGAAAWGNKPSPVFRERIRHGIELYQNHIVNYLIFTGGTPKIGYPTEAQVGKQFALKQGIDENNIFTENQSANTYTNLQNILDLIKKHHIRRIIIVSDPYHLARAQAIANDLHMNATYSATPTSRYSTGSSQETHFFWRETFYLSLFRLWQLNKIITGHNTYPNTHY